MSHSQLFRTIGDKASGQEDLATPKQVRLLRRMGVPNAETIGFEEAHEILSARFNPA